jgi:hypothetical protein
MEPAIPLQQAISDSNEMDIFALGRTIEAHITENWDKLLQKNQGQAE